MLFKCANEELAKIHHNLTHIFTSTLSALLCEGYGTVLRKRCSYIRPKQIRNGKFSGVA